VGQQRLRLSPDGQVVLELRRRWANGTRHLVFDPVELLERLAPGMKQLRFLTHPIGSQAPVLPYADGVGRRGVHQRHRQLEEFGVLSPGS